MDLLVIAVVAAGASLLTFVSGFGLGTILLPAFALFLPAPAAVAATGVVHLLNNLFKGTLLRARADWGLVLRFGLPAAPAALMGAWLLAQLGTSERLFVWAVAGRNFGPRGAGLVVGLVLIGFALLELSPRFRKLKAPASAMPVGGLVTGFFGGLTGQQGALRSIFLLKSGLAADRLIATGTMVAVIVDVARLITYGATFDAAALPLHGRTPLLVATGTLAAFLGAAIGARRIEKVTIGGIRIAVTALMLVIGAAMSLGIVGA